LSVGLWVGNKVVEAGWLGYEGKGDGIASNSNSNNVLVNHWKLKFIFQRVSVLIQRFNSILYHETFHVEEDTDM